jgi:archaeosine synthase beta-subunit
LSSDWTSEKIVALRPHIERPQLGDQPIAVFSEIEAADVADRLAAITTILLRGSECSFRCLMCDLWKNTHLDPTPDGTIPKQIQVAFERLEARQTGIGQNLISEYWVKLYNAANFFAPKNIPTNDLPRIAELVAQLDRVIVENHPRLITPRIRDFAKRLNGKLEVAMGLETVNEKILKRLNKQMCVSDVQRAVAWLLDHDIDVRLFILLRPPGLDELSAIEWCQASIDTARRWGVRHASIIPVRSGNGAMEHLQRQCDFSPPLASSLEKVLCDNVGKSSMIVTADLWDWDRMRGLCPKCSPRRLDKMRQVNLTQKKWDGSAIECDHV